jgi:high-affinity iron transporter
MRRAALASTALLVAAAAALALGCAAEEAADEARLGALLYRSHGCGACHGVAGQGDGPLAATLGAEVRDLTHGELRHGSTVEEIAATIGRGSGAMPPFPHIPEDDRRTLARWVRGLAGVAPEADTGLRVLPRGVRATPPGVRRTAAYLTLVNDGAADELVAVLAPRAGRASLHY